jgi:hypothetical protein
MTVEVDDLRNYAYLNRPLILVIYGNDLSRK